MSIATARFGKDDKVRIDSPKYPGVWTVAKVNPTTYLVTHPDRPNFRLRVGHEFALPAGESTDAGSAVTVPIPDYFEPGQVVTSRGRKMGTGLFVVLSQAPSGTCKVAVLGGDQGRSWGGVPASFLTVVSLADLPAALAR